MNRRQLEKLGVPDTCFKEGIAAVQNLVQGEKLKGKQVKQRVQQIVESPELFVADSNVGEFARALVEESQFTRPEPITYRTWGDAGIDPASHAQMRQACSLPVAAGAALMPDAHVGYGLPIGGVLACEGAVIPYAVGVDIACRMKLSVFDAPVDALENRREPFRDALARGTRFGVGVEHRPRQDHAVMDADWNVSRITREKKDTAWKQLGTSGSGNHFVEFGVLTLAVRDEQLGLDAGRYVALLSHSGSRGAGAAVCSTYSAIAQKQLPREHKQLGRLAWLDMNSQAGQEYWAAMNLMGEYAAANHACIHRHMVQAIGAELLLDVENHHNFAW
ncbi:MAG: RtcB family protein, partial [Planctomycetales bacterium]|nr:RtcB family protein [Planctomycetales bacterium]